MSKIKDGIGLTFDDVLIEPNISTIRSRSDVDISMGYDIGSPHPGIQLLTPIFSSCMDSVTEVTMAKKMRELGGYGVLHRYIELETQLDWLDELGPEKAFFAVGANKEDRERVNILFDYGVREFCVDVANGQGIYAAEMTSWIKDNYPAAAVMTGNVATADGWTHLESAGADLIRVGIGGGSFCTTRTTTGVGVPQLTSIMECTEASHGAILIADGGIRKPSDAAKAFAAGAQAIMLGGLLVGTDESPGEIFEIDDKQYKQGRGMSSYPAQMRRYVNDYDKIEKLTKIAEEGIVSKVPYIGSTESVINNLMGGLRSAMSYVGAENLAEFRDQSTFIRITNAGLAESHPHILTY